MAIGVFCVFVGIVLGISFFLGRKAKSAQGYFAAHGQIHWFVNGIAFAGDYLSAASFLGICGMIAFYGFDGFLYSIGFLAGWIVALFVVAEPLKKLGRYTFADALDSRFNSRGIKLSAAISTLVVSIFYLIPQMVGAGTLVTPLFNLPHEVGVIMVGIVVVVIVVTAGMVSTTWVQFIKGSLLVIFCTVLTVMILQRGFSTQYNIDGKETTQPFIRVKASAFDLATRGTILPAEGAWSGKPYVRVKNTAGVVSVWRKDGDLISETQTALESGGKKIFNGSSEGKLRTIGHVNKLPDGKTSTGPMGPAEFFTTLQHSEIMLWSSEKIIEPEGTTTIYFQNPTSGADIMVPGRAPIFKGIRDETQIYPKLDFLSLMLALFCGTASLPHILIRYYTVKDQASVRKSTVVGIASIGFFYVLTLFLGLGAMTSGALNVANSNMSAPLLAKSFGDLPFAVISAIAFTTVLGTVSGLIMAASGAVAHDLMTNFLKMDLDDNAKIRAGKIAAVVVGAIAMVLGIVFQKVNVSFLVGWAFNIAASANLPALVMLLFWKGTTKQGITAAIWVGMLSSLGWILLSADTYKDVYQLDLNVYKPLVPFSQPAIVTIPLGFLVLTVVSLFTQQSGTAEAVAREQKSLASV